MNKWNGIERRKQGDDHDLLTKIDAKMTLYFDSFAEHIEEDRRMFEKYENRIVRIEHVIWMMAGAVVFFEIVMKFINK